MGFIEKPYFLWASDFIGGLGICLSVWTHMGLWGHYTVVHLNIMKSSLAFCLDFDYKCFWSEAGKHL